MSYISNFGIVRKCSINIKIKYVQPFLSSDKCIEVLRNSEKIYGSMVLTLKYHVP